MAVGVIFGSYRDLGDATGVGCRTSFVIVVHDVDLSATRSTITAVATVVYDTVAEVDVLCLYLVGPIVFAIFVITGIAFPFVARAIESR